MRSTMRMIAVVAVLTFLMLCATADDAAFRIPDGWATSAQNTAQPGQVGYLIIHEPSGVEMAYVPGGTFMMGSEEGDEDEKPVHEVTLSPFYISRYEITNGQYCEFLNSALAQGLVSVIYNVVYKAGSGTNFPYCTMPSSSRTIAYSDGVFHVETKDGRDVSGDPMVYVSWFGAAAYCNWRSQEEGKQPCYNLSTHECDFSKNGYHLPTEAQWEYAARGGLSGKRFPWGDTIDESLANYRLSGDPYEAGDRPWTTPVGFYDGRFRDKADYNWPGSETTYWTSNSVCGYGLYDVAGNVREWCNDTYRSDYYSSSPAEDPRGPGNGPYRVLRGGGYNNGETDCRVAIRDSNTLSTCTDDLGFRVAQE